MLCRWWKQGLVPPRSCRQEELLGAHLLPSQPPALRPLGRVQAFRPSFLSWGVWEEQAQPPCLGRTTAESPESGPVGITGVPMGIRTHSPAAQPQQPSSGCLTRLWRSGPVGHVPISLSGRYASCTCLPTWSRSGVSMVKSPQVYPSLSPCPSQGQLIQHGKWCD